MKLWWMTLVAGTIEGVPSRTVVTKACRSHVLIAPWSPDSPQVWKRRLRASSFPPPKPSLMLMPARGTSKQMLFVTEVCADFAWKRHELCFSWMPRWRTKLACTTVYRGKLPAVPSGPVPEGCSGCVPLV